ncbi:hypothetical protein ACFYZT_07540 [Streptomyces sp. NPDC001591]|uniref:hypothetical protein n=1 Tax=Streptomyces sp. NPDC001591 TaxID=3364589 RepID=UPI0036CE7D86
MPSRLRLPLWVAVLLLAAGCVTVRPPAPAGAPAREPAASRPAGTPRPPAAPALPLGPAPDSQDAPPAGEADPQDVPPAGEADPQPQTGPRRPDASARQRSEDRLPRRSPARPAPAVEPRTREPVRSAPRPAPRRSYDMSALCEAAKGRVDPAIVALCR